MHLPAHLIQTKLSKDLAPAKSFLVLFLLTFISTLGLGAPIQRVDWTKFDQAPEFPNIFETSNGIPTEAQRDLLVSKTVEAIVDRVQLPEEYSLTGFKQGYFFRNLRSAVQKIDTHAQLLLSSELIQAAVSYIYKRHQLSPDDSLEAVCQGLMSEQTPIPGGDFFGLSNDLTIIVRSSESQKIDLIGKQIQTIVTLTSGTFGKLGQADSADARSSLQGLNFKVETDSSNKSLEQVGFQFQKNKYNLMTGMTQFPMTDFLNGRVRFLPENFSGKIEDSESIIRSDFVPLIFPWLKIINRDEFEQTARQSEALTRSKSDKVNRNQIVDRYLDRIDYQSAHNRVYRDPEYRFINSVIGDKVIGLSTETIPISSHPQTPRRLKGMKSTEEYLVDYSNFNRLKVPIDRLILYHASRKTGNVIRIRHGGFKISTSGDLSRNLKDGVGRVAGVGVYTDVNYRSVNHGEYKANGLVFALVVKKNANILNWEEFTTDPDFAKICAEAKALKIDVFIHLARAYGVDIVKATSIRSGASEHVVLNSEAVEMPDDIEMLKLEMDNRNNQIVIRDLYSVETIGRYIHMMESMGYEMPEYQYIKGQIEQTVDKYRRGELKLNGNYHERLLLEILPVISHPDTVHIVGEALNSSNSANWDAAVAVIKNGLFAPEVTKQILSLLQKKLIEKKFWTDLRLTSLVLELAKIPSPQYSKTAEYLLQAVPHTSGRL